MNKKLLIAYATTTLLALPIIALGFDAGPVPEPIGGLSIGGLIDVVFGIIWPIFVAFAIVMFIIAAFLFFTAQGDPEKVAQARQFVIWGVVGIVVAVIAFSIPFVIRNLIYSGT